MLAAFVALIVLTGMAFNWLLGGGPTGVVIAVVVAGAMAFVSFFSSDRIALAASGARPAVGPEFKRYHNLVEGLCIAAGLPKPKLYVVEDPSPNAFATGRNPQHAALAVTTGLLDQLTRVELEGVLAHELSHVKNYDILVTTLAVTAVGAVALLADVGFRFMFWGGRRSNDNQRSGGPGAILAILSLLLVVLAPLVARMMQFAMSRNREYLADVSAVALTRYPPGLCSALEKLRGDQAVVRKGTRATAQMWIESPLDRADGNKGSWLNRAFDTHPPLEDRIRRLKEM